MSTSQTPRLGHFHWKVLILCPVTPISRLEVSRTNFHDARLQAALQPSSCFSCIKLNLCHAFCNWCLLCSVLGSICSSTPKQDRANHPDSLTKVGLPEQYYEYETSLMISLANLSASLIRSRHHYIITSYSPAQLWRFWSCLSIKVSNCDESLWVSGSFFYACSLLYVHTV